MASEKSKVQPKLESTDAVPLQLTNSLSICTTSEITKAKGCSTVTKFYDTTDITSVPCEKYKAAHRAAVFSCAVPSCTDSEINTTYDVLRELC